MVTLAEWLAAGTGVVAAIMVALHAGTRITGIGFLIFLVSSVSWTIFGLIENDHGLVVQNVVLTAINIFGAWRYLIVQKPYQISLRKLLAKEEARG